MGKSKFVPHYKRIYNELRQGILEGVYPPGTQLPFERELCDKYCVERITVRKALSMLADENLIVKKPGVGSFVSTTELNHQKGALSDTVLFLMHKSQNDIRSNASAFNAQLFFPLEQACRENGFTLLYMSCTDGDDVREFILRSNAVCVFLVSTLPAEVYNTVHNMGIPAICINHICDHFVSILPNNARGIFSEVQHLVSLGHHDFAFIGGQRDSSNSTERLNGFHYALAANSCVSHAEWILPGDWTYEGGKAATHQLLANTMFDNRPTAIIAASDMMAIGCMDAVREYGLRVPEDISVVGFDDIDMARFCSPQLTTVTTDPIAMTRIAVKHMLGCLQNQNEQDIYCLHLPVKLNVRASSGPVKSR